MEVVVGARLQPLLLQACLCMSPGLARMGVVLLRANGRVAGESPTLPFWCASVGSSLDRRSPQVRISSHQFGGDGFLVGMLCWFSSFFVVFLVRVRSWLHSCPSKKSQALFLTSCAGFLSAPLDSCTGFGFRRDGLACCLEAWWLRPASPSVRCWRASPPVVLLPMRLVLGCVPLLLSHPLTSDIGSRFLPRAVCVPLVFSLSWFCYCMGFVVAGPNPVCLFCPWLGCDVFPPCNLSS